MNSTLTDTLALIKVAANGGSEYVISPPHHVLHVVVEIVLKINEDLTVSVLFRTHLLTSAEVVG